MARKERQPAFTDTYRRDRIQLEQTGVERIGFVELFADR